MATQHPDAATRYVAIQEEVAEAVHALSRPPLGLGIDEIMVDFEGKMTPYHQTNEIAQGLLDRGCVPGRDVWITPRISSATQETAFRQLMALMSVIEATYTASQREPAAHIEEVIIPMVRSADDLVKVRDRIRDVIYLGHKEFKLPYDPDALQLIPLLEEAPDLLSCGSLLREYVRSCADEGFGVRRLRVMTGRSDTALSLRPRRVGPLGQGRHGPGVRRRPRPGARGGADTGRRVPAVPRRRHAREPREPARRLPRHALGDHPERHPLRHRPGRRPPSPACTSCSTANLPATHASRPTTKPS